MEDTIWHRGIWVVDEVIKVEDLFRGGEGSCLREEIGEYGPAESLRQLQDGGGRLIEGSDENDPFGIGEYDGRDDEGGPFAFHPAPFDRVYEGGI